MGIENEKIGPVQINIRIYHLDGNNSLNDGVT